MGFKNIRSQFNRTGLIADFISGKYVGNSARKVFGKFGTFTATGGTTSEPGNGYKYHFFTSSSTPGFEALVGQETIEYLIIGGGGGGGSTPDFIGCGGGGAGGFRTGSLLVSPGAYPIVIGAGGAAQATTKGLSGLDSSITFPSPLVAAGGGGGGGRSSSSDVGGSGGGASGYDPPFTGSAGNQYSPRSPLFPAPAPGQGNPGGNGQPDPIRSGGGGGGAGAAGGNSIPTGGGGPGGNGLSAFTADTGIPPSYGTPGPTPGRWFSGGGGGGVSPPGGGSVGTGGAGGGGAGGSVAGTVNTGGGGGGANNSGTGGAGGSGIIIIRYPS